MVPPPANVRPLLVPLSPQKSGAFDSRKCQSLFVVLFLTFFAFECNKRVVGIDLEYCGHALGMESGRIRDDQLSVSSSFDPFSTGPTNARLNGESGSGAWCPQTQINATSHEWIQVEFGEEHAITGVRTQGRWDKGRGKEYPQGYMVEYWRESLNRWARYKDAHGNEIVRANSDTQHSVLRPLDGAIVAKFVRLVPVSEAIRTVCLRFELFGCKYKDALLSYSSSAASFSDAIDLRDSSYDGSAEEVKNGSGQLPEIVMRGGIGRLFDGTVGEDNFEERPEGWVGWRADEMRLPFVSVELFFSKVQNISALLLHTSNFRSGGALLFRSARLLFAPFGDAFSSRIIQFDMPPDLRAESARWVRIPTPNRIGTKVRLELNFGVAAKWLLISEIRIESEEVTRNGAQSLFKEENSNLTPKSEIFAEQSAEGKDGEEADGQRDTEGRGRGRECLLIAIFVCVLVLSLVLLCLCSVQLFRHCRPPRTSLKPSSPHSSASSSSVSSSTDHNSDLLQLLLKRALRRRIENPKKRSIKKISAPNFHLGEEGKELMDIAKLVIEHNGQRALISRTAAEEDSGQYADADEPTENNDEKSPLASSAFSPQFHSVFGRAKLRHFPSSSEYSIASFSASDGFSSSVDPSRYRRTPTLTQFPPLPPPLPSMPPPPRRQWSTENDALRMPKGEVE